MAFFTTVLTKSEPVRSLSAVYLSQSSNLQGRIRLHCSGTVQDSVLREKIALRMGFSILKKLKPKSNSVVKTIHSDDPSTSEKEVSAFLQRGRWKLVRPGQGVDLSDLQRFLNVRLAPSLKETDRSWNPEHEVKYAELMERLMASKELRYSDNEVMPELPGIYLFLHDQLP